jgi:hypothetical protein
MPREKLSLSPRRVMQAVDRFLFLWLSRILVAILAALVFPLARLSKPQPSVPTKGPHLMIAAGVKGWELIEYQEIFASASEYLGSTNVSRLVFTGDRPMLAEFREALRKVRPSHYYFDPRSGSQTPLKAAWETLVVGFLLERYQVTPICALTDFPVRRWRLQAATVSARKGVVTSLMSPSVIGKLFPHKRIVGPMPFPLSVSTLKRLQQRKRSNKPNSQHRLRDKAVFVGMLYEPRKTTIEAIQKGLSERGIPMEIIGRMPDGSRISDNDYWDILCSARLIVSTSSQIAGKHTDFDGHNHFIYKFIEVTAAGTALAIEPVEASEHLLRPDIDYIAYSSVDEAVAKIASEWHSQPSLALIGQHGAAQTTALIEGHLFWGTVLPKEA